MCIRVIATAIALLPLIPATTRADVLWDNDITPNGVNGRALSPPAFPTIRVADDFVVPVGDGWVIEDFHAAIIEDSAWSHGGRLDLFVYEDTMGIGPGDEIVHVTDAFTRMPTGDEYFGRDAYEYRIEGLSIELGPGTYWIGLRNPDGDGAGTNYWLTSDGGPDGKNSSPGYFSLDGGITWSTGGVGWHHAFEITGVPEAGGFALLSVSALLIFRRRAKH
jgi:hypothetical protein